MAKKNDHKREQAREYLEQGKPANWIGYVLDVHPTTVQRWAQKFGFKLKHPHNGSGNVSVELIQSLSSKTLASGKKMFTRKEIAEMVGCSEATVKKVRAYGHK
jgi:uncharacterized protein YjcR